jgi:hypothetical protein
VHTTVAIDHDQSDLQHVVTAQGQPGRLDVDDCEPHGVELRIHVTNPTPGV